ncbi:MAG: 5'-methylthioadenosine/adenosylhomocysteine nucleosidase [Solobacterium sp.]|nr:5'-methylthioadenosine/adenosylhomocysteine nucleosidase [Solobacterium sp.]
MKQEKIGVIGAMAPEVELLHNHMHVEKETVISGMTFWEGDLEGTPLVLVQSGIGKVNAAICAEILILEFGITHLLNTGIAGSLDDDIHIGDIVISTDALQHDMNVTALGYEPGEIPLIGTLAFPSDESFRKRTVDAAKLAVSDVQIFEGRVVSGDQFISDQTTKDRLREQFGGRCAEMEGAAIAQAAYINHIPFVIVRSISDNANDETGKEYEEIELEASARSSRLTAEILKSFAE